MKNYYSDEKIKREEKKILDLVIREFNRCCNIYKGDNGRELVSISISGCIPDGYYSNSKKFNIIYNLISHGYIEHLRDYLRKYNMSLSLDYWSDEKTDTDFVNCEILWDYQKYYQNSVKEEKNLKKILQKNNK